MHAVHLHIAANRKVAMPDLQQPFNGRKVRLALQAILLPVPVLFQGSCLNLLQQRGGHVGVLVDHLLPLCQLRQTGDGAHQVASVGLHHLIGVRFWVHVRACSPVQICHRLDERKSCLCIRVLVLRADLAIFSCTDRYTYVAMRNVINKRRAVSDPHAVLPSKKCIHACEDVLRYV